MVYILFLENRFWEFNSPTKYKHKEETPIVMKGVFSLLARDYCNPPSNVGLMRYYTFTDYHISFSSSFVRGFLVAQIRQRMNTNSAILVFRLFELYTHSLGCSYFYCFLKATKITLYIILLMGYCLF